MSDPYVPTSKNQLNARVQARYDELRREGKHGHYESMFRVVQEELQRATAAPAFLPVIDEELFEHFGADVRLIDSDWNWTQDAADLLAILNARTHHETRALFPRQPTANECWEAVNALIKPGDLGGNGCDKTAERNGLILAANAIAALIHPPVAVKANETKAVPHCPTCACDVCVCAAERGIEPTCPVHGSAVKAAGTP